MERSRDEWIERARTEGHHGTMVEMVREVGARHMVDDIVIDENVWRLSVQMARIPPKPWSDEWMVNLAETVESSTMVWGAWTRSFEALRSIVDREVTRLLDERLCVDCRGIDQPISDQRLCSDCTME